MLAILLSLSLSECDTQGVHVEFGKAEHDLAEAYYDSADDSGTHYIVLTGSFMPTSDGVHQFTVTCETYFTSVGYPAVAHLEWDGKTVDSGKDSWTWNSKLQKDFRYSFKCTTDDNFYWATLRLEVTLPTGEFFTVNQDYADTCTDSGCRNLSLTRATNCEPPTRPSLIRPVRERGAQPAWAPQRALLGRGIAIACGVGAAAVAAVVVAVALVVRANRRRAAKAKFQEQLIAGTEEAKP